MTNHGGCGTVASAARAGALLALPFAVCARLSTHEGADATASEASHYLRRVAARSYDGGAHGVGGGLTSLASFLRLRPATDNNEEESAIGMPIDRDLDDGRLDLSPVGDVPVDESERRLQRTGPKWYVSWYEGKCVQSCPPSPKNPRCAGQARWDQLLFDTAEYCCQLNLNWQPLEDCIGVDPGGSTEFNGITSLSEANYDEDRCPPEYSDLTDYFSDDRVTVYLSETEGLVYRCKDGPLFQYCSIFPPDWSRQSAGGGSVHTTDSLGWELVGDCGGGPTTLASAQDGARPVPLGEEFGADPSNGDGSTNPVSPADVGFGLDPRPEDGSSGLVSPAEPGFALGAPPSGDGSTIHTAPVDGGSGLAPGLSVVDVKPRPIKPKPSQPNGGKTSSNRVDSASLDSVRPTPGRPGKPNRPYKPSLVVQQAPARPVVQQAPASDEGDDLGVDEDGMSCYRSGKGCGNDAEIFACCTMCMHGVCI